jgi:hypothetical protein
MVPKVVEKGDRVLEGRIVMPAVFCGQWQGDYKKGQGFESMD